MSSTKFNELLHLYVLGELDEKNKETVENHLLESAEYKKEYETLLALKNAMVQNKPVRENSLLTEARRDLRIKLYEEQYNAGFTGKLNRWFREMFYSTGKAALGGAVMLLFGFTIGYLFFYSNTQPVNTKGYGMPVEIADMNPDEIQIRDIYIPNPFENSSRVEIRFSKINPVTYTGDLNDPETQKILALALESANNPGVAIKTINTLSVQSINNKSFIPDEKVKRALITRLKRDNNPGVRREALNVLLNFRYDTEIRDAFLYVLNNDENAGLRIAAINALFDIRAEGNIDAEIKNVLTEKADSDENDFIRIRAAKILEGEK